MEIVHDPHLKIIADYLQDVRNGKTELVDITVNNHVKKIHDGFSVIGFVDTEYTTIIFTVRPKVFLDSDNRRIWKGKST